MSSAKSTARDMTSGPILKQLVAFALPLMLGNIFQMLYNTVDSVIVGNFVSKQALAAIGSTTVIVNMLVFFFNGFSIGAAVVIGRCFGARNMEKLHAAVETTMAATFVLSAFFTLLGVALVKPMLLIMRTPEDVFADATLYLRIYFGGISGLLIYNMGSGILRAVGDSTRPLYFLVYEHPEHHPGPVLCAGSQGRDRGRGHRHHSVTVCVGGADPGAADPFEGYLSVKLEGAGH